MEFIDELQSFIDNFKQDNLGKMLSEKIERELQDKMLASIIRQSVICTNKEELIIQLSNDNQFFKDKTLENSSEILYLASGIINKELISIQLVR